MNYVPGLNVAYVKLKVLYMIFAKKNICVKKILYKKIEQKKIINKNSFYKTFILLLLFEKHIDFGSQVCIKKNPFQIIIYFNKNKIINYEQLNKF